MIYAKLTFLALLVFVGCGVRPEDKNQAKSEDQAIDGDDVFFADEFALGPNRSRECEVLANGNVVIKKKITNELNSVETWSAGASLGNANGNIGFTSSDGSVNNGSPTGAQTQALGCSSENQLLVGWKFSNNVKDLSSDITIDRQTVRYNPRTGVTTTTKTLGNRKLTYLDPATQYPYTNRPSQAFYDERAGTSAEGRVYLHRTVQLGTASAPLIIDRERSGGRLPTQHLKVHTSTRAPVHEMIVRTLENGRPLLERHVISGTYVVEFGNGVTVETDLSNLVYRRQDANEPAPHRGVCAARSGTMVHMVQKAFTDYPSLSIRAEKNALSNYTRYRCNVGISQSECNRRGSFVMEMYAPPACLY